VPAETKPHCGEPFILVIRLGVPWLAHVRGAGQPRPISFILPLTRLIKPVVACGVRKCVTDIAKRAAVSRP
jgi:hypothetical protein